jgi:SAM-dependent methyltransferase
MIEKIRPSGQVWCRSGFDLDRSGASAKGGAMKLKSVELDLTALMSEVMFGHGYAHYGYFPDGVPEVLSASLPWVRRSMPISNGWRLLFHDAGRRHTILDVGSGTGANARALIERGYQVACVSPSAQMNEMARAKLPEGTIVTDATFETFDTETRFDICLFAESFPLHKPRSRACDRREVIRRKRCRHLRLLSPARTRASGWNARHACGVLRRTGAAGRVRDRFG